MVIRLCVAVGGPVACDSCCCFSCCDACLLIAAVTPVATAALLSGAGG